MRENFETDETLCALAQKGDILAVEELLFRYKNAVRSFARKFFLAGFETEDLVQEGMIGLYSAIEKFQSEKGRNFRGFAYFWVRNRIIDEIRKGGKYKGNEFFDPDTLLSDGGTPEDFVLDGESRTELDLKLMGTLSDFEFRVMKYYLMGYSYAEIVVSMGKSIKSVDNALARAKKKLRRAFEQIK